ncbi:hypothetical protein BHF71_01045 [Vulcanibacillus modesticaldus]|uniref:Polysaccharide chain length determinant N-terminal domain-containing protein n=1 Tax=Vulcanibacillus modesticaldus TaxID=337097 RepID=A0A1D2YVN9_9BACI|nr:Wzz/FepE/Etk N-terminal domain-containing protein [Vulcanibacillus modesticaldus]OEF99792.1 hypothetical protein BHF71_01045 [Vulcanibacillus modesticaldus]
MEQSYEEISLRELIEILLKGKKIIIWTTIIAMIISAFVSFFMIAPTYEVTASVIVKDIKGEKSSSVIGSIMDSEVIPLQTLISAFKSTIAGPDMLEQLRIISPEWENIQANALKNMIKIELVKDTTQVNIIVSAHSAKDTVALANIVTNSFQQFVEEQNYDTLVAKVKSVKRQMEIDIELLNNKIAKAEQQLAELDEVLVYKKSIVDDSYLQELAAKLASTTVINLSELSIENEEPNPAYLKVLDSITANKLALSNLKSQYAELVKAEGQLKEIAKETGMKASIVRDVVEPGQPVKPNKMLNIAIAGVLGLMISVFVVFMMEYWRNTEK